MLQAQHADRDIKLDQANKIASPTRTGQTMSVSHAAGFQGLDGSATQHVRQESPTPTQGQRHLRDDMQRQSGIVPSRGDLTSKSSGHARSNSAKNDGYEYSGRQRGRQLLHLR